MVFLLNGVFFSENGTKNTIQCPSKTKLAHNHRPKNNIRRLLANAFQSLEIMAGESISRTATATRPVSHTQRLATGKIVDESDELATL